MLSSYRIFANSGQRLMQIVTMVLFADSMPSFIMDLVDPSEDSSAYLVSIRKATEVRSGKNSPNTFYRYLLRNFSMKPSALIDRYSDLDCSWIPINELNALKEHMETIEQL